MGRDFVAKGVRKLVRLFRKRWSIERLFGRAKEWLMLDGLRVTIREDITRTSPSRPDQYVFSLWPIWLP